MGTVLVVLAVVVLVAVLVWSLRDSSETSGKAGDSSGSGRTGDGSGTNY